MPKLMTCGSGNATHVVVALGSHAGWEVNIFTAFPDEAVRHRLMAYRQLSNIHS
jgi:hypothetical protein